jgi:uncharacterized protein (TIGR02452 family)
MREQRKRIAHETLKIQQQGFYLSLTGKRVEIKNAQQYSEKNSRLISPTEGELLVKSFVPPAEIITPSCEVMNASTVQAIIYAVSDCHSVSVLNFASAKNPGGGFLNGAMAQEEALAASSGLYGTLLKHKTYYEINRACHSAMYTSHAIYSPDVVFFRDAGYNLLSEPVMASILTLPAVNMGQVREKGESINQAKQAMKERMRLCLAILAREKQKTIILGAYGCGVFCNDPYEVACWWQELLFEEGYGSCFKRVIFAVLDKPGGENISPFELKFGGKKK